MTRPVSRYTASRVPGRQRGRYPQWGVRDTQAARWMITYCGEFARNRAEHHAALLNRGGLAAGFQRIFGGR